MAAANSILGQTTGSIAGRIAERREPWKTIQLQDPAGIWGTDLVLTQDGKSYAYNCKRLLNDLYLVEGLE